MTETIVSENLTMSLAEIEAYRDQGGGVKSGKKWRYFCPIHGSDNQRSFEYDPETGKFKCYLDVGSTGAARQKTHPGVACLRGHRAPAI